MEQSPIGLGGFGDLFAYAQMHLQDMVSGGETEVENDLALVTKVLSGDRVNPYLVSGFCRRVAEGIRTDSAAIIAELCREEKGNRVQIVERNRDHWEGLWEAAAYFFQNRASVKSN
ncbi:MAG: hypothetical protein PHS44_03975 [Candidatus Dojkabacteria bacterium]|jgi:hypothetical protein|nr:hypothetical protein [Candidatus Dojkabacteria bacterium]